MPKMTMSKSLILPLVAFLLASGCSAYRPISKGSIKGSGDWEMRSAGWRIGNYKRETSVLASRERQVDIGYTPCNYGSKLVFSILPFPAPLDREAKLETGPFFVKLLTVKSIGHGFSLDLKGIVLTTASGNKLNPIAYDSEQYFQKCYQYSGAGNKHENWKQDLSKPVLARKYPNTNMYFLSLALMYEMEPPALDEEFMVSVRMLSHEGERLIVPDVTFSKGGAWGGW